MRPITRPVGRARFRLTIRRATGASVASDPHSSFAWAWICGLHFSRMVQPAAIDVRSAALVVSSKLGLAPGVALSTSSTGNQA